MRIRILSVSCCCLLAIATLFATQPHATYAQAMSGEDAPKKLLSPPAKTEVKLSDATISIDYNQPSVRGRKIFGGLVPYGKVWRTGANPATSLKTTGTLMIGDLTIPAGSYTLYTLPTEAGWQLIINKQTGQWGTEYDEKQDLGRTAMMVGKTDAPVEMMTISFEKTVGDDTEMHIKWADLDVSVKVMAMK